ncbi:cellobiose-specific PTS IIA CelA [Streptococcus varani]|uniref:Cellobiose-specific PTS IIA CelA n=1 Tax=Streptococcus varani TaxID=1608583 RepID=A0A0E3WER5_9STRE|nr:PTS lactose/cellobiose transporter subunit IIA [Streptococcus varani]CQR24161.1 cellobiose-specific PTS IIA CelA [Streptococcus varani]
MENENMLVFMELIMHSGNGKSDAFEAIQFAKNGDFEQADAMLASAKKSLIEAHHVQTNMLTEEARGSKTEMTLLGVHSQDHLMTAMTFMDLAVEMIDMYKKMYQQKNI